MKKLYILFLFIVLSLCSYAQSDTSAASTSANTSFLDFVKKVYFNPTILLKTQNFKAANNVQIQLLPSNSSQSPQSIKGFELAMQKVIRFILESGSEGIVRYYFNPNFPSTPFSVVYSEELHCKFTSADIDSITSRLNAPFKNAPINYNNSALFEGAIQAGMDYTAQCLRNNPGKCGKKPENLISEINTKPLYITLHNTNGSKYDTDTFRYENYSSYYTQVYDLFTQQNVHVPAKLFIAGGSTEPLSLAIHKREANILKQNFRIVYMATEQALELEPGSSADSLKIKLPQHLPANQIAEFGIYYKSPQDSITYLVSSFMVHVYTEKVINLHLVPVDGVAIPQQNITAALKKMYDPVGVKFNISTTKSISSESFLTKDITIENSGLLSSYSKDLRNYVGAVKDLNNYDKDDYYIVFGLSCNNGVTGYMPRKSNIGFVFTGAANAGDVLAHEIGHGAFHLRHIFSDEELGASMQGMTKNLMDYVQNPTDLYVSQWEGIDDPVSVGWFEGDDEEAEYTIYELDYQCIPDGITFSNDEVFLDLDGNKIKLDVDYAPYLFVGQIAGLEGRIAGIRKKSTGELYLPKARAGSHGYFHWTFGKITSSYAGIPYTGSNSATTLTSNRSHYTLTRNNQHTEIEYPFYEDCPGIPKGSAGGSSPNIYSSKICGENIPLKYKHQLDSCMLISDIEDAAEGVAFFINKEEDCAISNLTITQRAEYLGLLVQHDGSWIIGNKNVLLKLIKQIPLKDELALLNKFKEGNFSWLSSLTSHLDEWFDNDAPDREVLSQVFEFMTTLINRNYANLNVPVSDSFTQTYYTPTTGLTLTGSQTYSIDIPAAAFPIIVGANPSSELEMGLVPGDFQGRAGMGLTFKMGSKHPLTPVSYANGSVLVTQQYKLVETPFGAQIMAPGTVIDDYVVYDLYSEDYSIHPYEFVEVIFAQNYPELGFSKGQSIYVPAYYAFILNNLVNATDFDRNLAEFVDKLEIGLAVITICTSPINPVGALTIFSGVLASVDLAVNNKLNNGEMTQEEYDSDYYQTYKKAKFCLDVATGIANMPQLAVGLTKITKSAILGSVRLGQNCIRNGKHIIIAFAIRNAVRNAKLGNTLPNATALMREVAECVRTGKTYVYNAGRLVDNLKGALKSTYDDIVRFGGSAVENNGVIRLLNSSGDEIATIANGKILPTKYYNASIHSGATPIGQPANGYQVFKNGDDLIVKRMPDKSAYSQSEINALTEHPNAHVLERHGHDVTDEALIKRANVGIAPDGSTIASGNPPPYSSKFESSQKVVEAFNNTKPGTIAFNNGVQQGNRKIVTYTSTSGNFGKGVPSNGNSFQTTNKVLAIYQDIGGGNYKLLTMYPDF